jgi:uncharacterized cupin superfamily protein
MDALITIIPACDVTALYKEEAQQWSKWDSKNRKKFPYNYATEERVLVIKGSATLTPDDGSPAVTINAGDAVTFRIGFKCKWLITKRMTKHYAVFASLQDDAQEVEEGGITCDVCEVDWLLNVILYPMGRAIYVHHATERMRASIQVLSIKRMAKIGLRRRSSLKRHQRKAKLKSPLKRKHKKIK